MRRPSGYRPCTGLILTMVLAGCAAPGAPASGEPAAPPSEAAVSVSASLAPASAAPSAASQLVAIGNRSIWLECTGEGATTVVLESGLGGDHRTWDRVKPELSDRTQVCTYDRAGIAESDAVAGTRTASDAVEDLHDLLAAADIEPPYVLVGFSFGGAISQLYASTYPDDVSGLVLVESNHPLETEQFEEHLTAEQIEIDRSFALDNPEGIDPHASLEELQAADPLPDVPLVVVTAGRSEGWPPGWDAEVFDGLRAAQQADLATFTSQGRQVIAEDSAHHVPSQQPEIIIEAVESVLAELAG